MTERDLITLGHTLGTIVFVGTIVLRRRAQRKRQYQELLSAHRRALYMADMLVRHGVEPDEFDLIAIAQS